MKKEVQEVIAFARFLLLAALLLFVSSRQIFADEAPATDHTVCNDGPPACNFTSVQAAVDAAAEGDVVKVAAGHYTGVNTIGGAKQLVYIAKSITIKGGYDLDFNEPPDPLINATRLDAQYQGRVFCIIGDFGVTLEGLTITGGDAFKASPDGRKCNEYDDYNSLEAGGGIAANGATISVTNSTITGNNARWGAGIFLMKGEGLIAGNLIAQNSGQGVQLSASSASLTGNTVSHNKGGGIEASNSEGITIENNVVTGNYEGSGISLAAKNGQVVGNTIRNNDAHIPGGYGNGGGVRIDYGYPGSEVLVADNLIEGNSAHAGGGIHIANGPTVARSNVICGNVASFYSGVYLTGDEAIILEGNEIISNETTFSTSVVGVYQCKDVTLTANKISENIGVGLQIEGGEVSIADSAFTSNNGGGITISCCDSKVHLENSTVSGNHAEYGGGGIEAGGELTIINSTIANNSAEHNGANLSVSHPQVSMANSIIANAIQKNCLINTPLVSKGHNLDDDGSCGLSERSDMSHSGAGLFVLADYGGGTLTHALLPNSPAIDGGDSTLCPSHDQRGKPRPLDGNKDGNSLCDIGSFEVDPLNDPEFFQARLPICLSN